MRERLETIVLWILAGAFCTGLYVHHEATGKPPTRQLWSPKDEAAFSKLMDRKLTDGLDTASQERLTELRARRREDMRQRRERRTPDQYTEFNGVK